MKPPYDIYTDAELVSILSGLRWSINTVREAKDMHEAIMWLESQEEAVVRAMLDRGLKPDDVKEMNLEG